MNFMIYMSDFVAVDLLVRNLKHSYYTSCYLIVNREKLLLKFSATENTNIHTCASRHALNITDTYCHTDVVSCRIDLVTFGSLYILWTIYTSVAMVCKVVVFDRMVIVIPTNFVTNEDCKKFINSCLMLFFLKSFQI